MDETFGLTLQNIIVLGMAPARGQLMTMSQLQKLFFLINDNVGEYLSKEAYFSFFPGDYGPIDKNLNRALSSCIVEKLMLSHPWNMCFYQLTKRGQEKGEWFLKKLPVDVSKYIEEINDFILEATLPQLLSSIYQAYPHMAVNAVFAK